jgi:uncharacterized protein (TIGR00730 family)
MPESTAQPSRASNAMQVNSPAYQLAALDQNFILGESMRGVRLQLEYAKVDEALRAWGVRSTVVVFGSGRVREDGPPHHATWYRQARQFARIVSERGGAKTVNGRVRDNVIATGGGPGLMEAANRGASDAGAPSIGFNIALAHEQQPNPYTTPDLTFRFQYFAIRKMHLAMRANALVVFPGGFGTLDELFEILTLKQTGKISGIPVVLFDRDHWQSLVKIDLLVSEGLISPDDVHLFQFADDPESAWRILEGHLLRTFEPRSDSP